MRANSGTIAVAHQWVTKAENDLKNAAHTLKMGRDARQILWDFTHSSA